MIKSNDKKMILAVLCSLLLLSSCAGAGSRRAGAEAVPASGEVLGSVALLTGDSAAQVSAPARPLPDSAGFMLERTEHDFGRVALGATVSTTFRLEAQGGPVVLLSAESDCGCTRAEFPNRPLRPGDTAQVKVVFAAKDKGNFYKTVRLHLHAGERDRTAEVKVRGTVL